MPVASHAARLFCIGLLAALSSTSIQAGESTNKIGITMVDIPAGNFLMGSCISSGAMNEKNKKRAFLGKPGLVPDCPDVDPMVPTLIDPEASDNETPTHRVRIKVFQMGKTEVTLGQFKRYIAAADRSDLVNDEFMKYNAYGDDAPVVMVSWHDAQAFIDWLNQTVGGGYRLPTEAEWEYACRAGSSGAKYCGGHDPDLVGWYEGNSGGRQHSVGRKKANAFGLYDMSGNAWEWVQDCWHDSYRGAPSDGSAWTHSCTNDGRGLRGGSWSSNAWFSRAANRDDGSPGNRGYGIGFRLARTR